jgi:hypothetical protein
MITGRESNTDRAMALLLWTIERSIFNGLDISDDNLSYSEVILISHVLDYALAFAWVGGSNL